MMTPTQCRMARAALGWTGAQLADAAQVGSASVNRFEIGQNATNPATIAAMKRALEDAGVIFMAPGQMKTGGDGVRLRAANAS